MRALNRRKLQVEQGGCSTVFQEPKVGSQITPRHAEAPTTAREAPTSAREVPTSAREAPTSAREAPTSARGTDTLSSARGSCRTISSRLSDVASPCRRRIANDGCSPLHVRSASEESDPSHCGRASVGPEAPGEGDAAGGCTLETVSATEEAGEEAADVPALLAIVQATCATLAERLKSQMIAGQRQAEQTAAAAPSETTAGIPPGPVALPQATAALAAQALRDVLGEVEAAIGAPAGAGKARADGRRSWRRGPAGSLRGAPPQWFDVSTPPLGGPRSSTCSGTCSVFSAASSLTYGTSHLAHVARRSQGWPAPERWAAPGIGEAAQGVSPDASEAEATGLSPQELPCSTPVLLGAHDLLEEWMEDERCVDPCPLLRPPRVDPPMSPVM